MSYIASDGEICQQQGDPRWADSLHVPVEYCNVKSVFAPVSNIRTRRHDGYSTTSHDSSDLIFRNRLKPTFFHSLKPQRCFGVCMHAQKAIFLTQEEAVDAIRRDLQHYGAQTDLLCELFPIVMGAGALALPDEDRQSVWIKQKSRGPMRSIRCSDLAETLFTHMTRQAASTERLAEFCRGIFKETATPGRDRHSRQAGVWVETGMDGYNCRQCGRCCLTLDYHAECTAADYRRWQAASRDDILRWVRLVPGKNGVPAYRIWVAPGTDEPVSTCPFLTKQTGNEKRTCAIHAVKPEICRQYPFTRKHARMTGCPAFD